MRTTPFELLQFEITVKAHTRRGIIDDDTSPRGECQCPEAHFIFNRQRPLGLADASCPILQEDIHHDPNP
jgi:hypothetical protein